MKKSFQKVETLELCAALRSLMCRWAAGEIDAAKVHGVVEYLWDSFAEVPEFSLGDERSIAIEVLSQLEILDQQLVTPEDIPEILKFLSTPQGDEREAWSRWERYWDGLDYRERSRSLEGNPFYSTRATDQESE